VPRTVQWQAGKKVTPETLVKREIRSGLKYTGWFCFHVLQGMGAYKGIPDMIAVRRGVTIYIEAKAPKGTQSDDQKEFQRRLEAAGGCYVLARSFADVESAIMRITGQAEKRLF
jgi:Holliday junction resolvase